MANQDEVFKLYGRTYNPGDVICREGEMGSEMFIIQSGKVRISKKSKDLEKTLVILEGGDFFGEMAVIDKQVRSATATAVEETKLIALNEEVFEQQMQNNARIVKKILKNMSARIRDANKQIENLLIRDANSRVASTLLQLALRYGRGATSNIRMDFQFTVEELAGMVGMTGDRQKLDEIVDKLIRAKVIAIQEGQILIVSLENLEKFVKFLEMKEQFGL
jgi:CRP-like cAMP-binding protein